MADYDLSEAFENIENELIDSMMRNFSHHRAEETKEGYSWSQWQVEQLQALEKYRQNNSKRFNKEFTDLNGKLTDMLVKAKADGSSKEEARILEAIKKGAKLGTKNDNAVTGEFFKTNDRKLNALIKATTNDLNKAEQAVLRMSNDQYRKAIFNAQVYANTGAGTYEQAVDMACRDMLRAGLNCVEYKNGARHTLENYARMAIRTANKRAYLYGEGEKRQEWDIDTVVVNSRQGGCSVCAEYVGEIFIDDVYSGGKANGKYPLLSEAMANGLFHPNCKDSTSTYIEGITELDHIPKSTINDMEQKEKLENRVSLCENQQKKYQRIADYSLDKDNQRKYQQRADGWKNQAEMCQNRLLNFNEVQDYKLVEMSENITIRERRGLEIHFRKVENSTNEIYSSENVNLKKRDLHKLDSGLSKMLWIYKAS